MFDSMGRHDGIYTNVTGNPVTLGAVGVIKATAFVNEKGRAAFAELRTKDSEWFHGNSYLFIYDANLTVLLNPAFPQREGKNVHGEHDSTAVEREPPAQAAPR